MKSLSLDNASAATKALSVVLQDGTNVPAAHMSEGLLYYLAFAAIPYLDGTGVILLEEPENGLHPARIRDVMSILREISKTTQVILATHSPLVVNELEGHEVTLMTRADGKVTATPLNETYNFQERATAYSNGELWLAYADGTSERDLLAAPEPAAE